jgi:hypothetical protein
MQNCPHCGKNVLEETIALCPMPQHRRIGREMRGRGIVPEAAIACN